MKSSILVMLFSFTINCYGQKDCPPGYSWMPSLDHTDLKIIADTCLPDSTCKKLWNWFGRVSCENSGLAIYGTYWRYSVKPIWSDSCGCTITRHWFKRIGPVPKVPKYAQGFGGKWVEVKEDEYNKANPIKIIK